MSTQVRTWRGRWSRSPTAPKRRRMDKIEKMKGEIRAQDKVFTQQEKMSSQMENMSTNMMGMPELLEFIRRQSQRSVPLGVPQGETTLDPVVDGGASVDAVPADGGANVSAAPATDVGPMIDGGASAVTAPTTEVEEAVTTGGAKPHG